jgi:hypothetical protein
MGFAFLDQYDVSACAALCDKRGADGVGGVCQFFNIWRAVVNGVPTTYTCSMVSLPLTLLDILEMNYFDSTSLFPTLPPLSTLVKVTSKSLSLVGTRGRP